MSLAFQRQPLTASMFGLVGFWNGWGQLPYKSDPGTSRTFALPDRYQAIPDRRASVFISAPQIRHRPLALALQITLLHLDEGPMVAVRTQRRVAVMAGLSDIEIGGVGWCWSDRAALCRRTGKQPSGVRPKILRRFSVSGYICCAEGK